MGKFFNLLKPKSYLSSLENTAHSTQVNSLFTASPMLLKASEQVLSTKLLSRTTPTIFKLRTNNL